jgi:hypothetical protein
VVVDAHRDGKRFVVRADEKLAAFWNSHGRFELDTKDGGQNRLLRRELKSES